MATAPSRPLARPYRDFLMPALHRRFASAALLTLAVCFAEQLTMPRFDGFWIWFPLGPAGLRTLMLFMSILMIYVLRVAQLHVGTRNTTSPIQTAWKYALQFNTLRTFGFYTLSAWLFSEVYIWSQPASSALSMVDHGRPYERARLNEKPIYLRTMFLVLGVQQAIWHIYHDYDRVKFPALKVGLSGHSSTTSNGIESGLILQTPISRLRQQLPSILNRSLIRAGATTIAGPAMYSSFLRFTVWHWTFAIASTMFTLPKNSKPAAYPPYVFNLLWRFTVQAFFLIFLWEFANAAFNIYVTQQPLKKAMPLTNDSKDPNGSLIAGLKAKKDMPRSMAFWELNIIAHSFEARRISIYKDLDRIGGSAWVQILTVCLGELHAIVKRIQDFQNPRKPDTEPQATFVDTHPMPRLAQPLQNGNILVPSPRSRGLGEAVALGVSNALQQNNPNNGISPRKLIAYSKDKLLTKGQQEQLSPAHVQGQAQSFGLDFIKTPAGVPFRTTFARAAACIVIGAPYGNISPIVDAISSISRLAIFSLKEDPYGKVHADVATIIRTFTSTIDTVESLMSTLQPSWTDVEFHKSPRARHVQEIDTIVAVLRTSLGDLINEFGEYQDSIGLTLAEVRKAKEAVQKRDQSRAT